MNWFFRFDLLLCAIFWAVISCEVIAQSLVIPAEKKPSSELGKTTEPEKLSEKSKPETKSDQKHENPVIISGFVDVYYNYTLNNKHGNQVDTSETFHQYNKQFAVNSTELDLEKFAKKESPWGFRVDFMYGQNPVFQERPSTVTNNIFNMNLLQQAYVSLYFPLLKGLHIEAGKMAGHIGFDSLESMNMNTYTLGYIFYNVPFINTGARAVLKFSENWTFSFFFYNSAQGTGYANPNSSNVPPSDKLTNSFLTDTTRHAYSDGLNKAQTVGTRLNGDIVKDRISITWNLMLGDDNEVGRISNKNIYFQDLTGVPATIPPTKSKYDYYFIHQAWITLHPSEKYTFTLDWTHQIRSGSTAVGNGAYVLDGTKQIGSYSSPITIGRDDKDVKRINNTYAVFAKYTFTEKWALGFRYENIDDRRYGGSYVANPPLSQITPVYRYDLVFLDSIRLRKPSNLGQVRSVTLTPTYIFSENIIIKLDFRKDWALGKQFIDIHGNPAQSQIGFILGLVTKF